MKRLNLDPGESVIMEVRRHWFVFVSYGIFSFLAGIAPFIVYESIINFLIKSIPTSVNVSAIFWFFYSIWLLILWMSFFVQWTNYYLDVWYITQKRIIDVDQRGMFHREVSSLRFDKIQDVSVKTRGILAHFFNFGDVRVQTAAEDSSDFSITSVADPERMREIIFSHHNKEAEKVVSVSIQESNGKNKQ